jgi:hypothetical protein
VVDEYPAADTAPPGLPPAGVDGPPGRPWPLDRPWPPIRGLPTLTTPATPSIGPPAGVPSVPAAPAGTNPFDAVPFPSPGDRIKADDFKMLSRSLCLIYDTYALSSALSGRSFGEVKLALAAQRYQVLRAMSVFGAAVDDPNDVSLDQRRVLQIVPAVLGEPRVLVLLSEAVDTRRFAPNLIGLTYREAAERLRTLFGDAAPGSRPVSTPQLVGLTLGQAREALTSASR